MSAPNFDELHPPSADPITELRRALDRIACGLKPLDGLLAAAYRQQLDDRDKMAKLERWLLDMAKEQGRILEQIDQLATGRRRKRGCG